MCIYIFFFIKNQILNKYYYKYRIFILNNFLKLIENLCVFY